MGTKVSISCISWIDQAPLPKVGFWFLAGAKINWSKRVIMGLVATSNPRPSKKILDIRAFMREKQYRAVLSCVIELKQPARIENAITDAGYTPAFDKNKIDTGVIKLLKLPDASGPGIRSAISDICVGRLHPSSSLTLKKEYRIIASGLIKFRAGDKTDKIGIEEAESPVHVPWVWPEFALVSSGSSYRLLCNGSIFPSHAWYVDGLNVATSEQRLVTISEEDPILNVGRPASQTASKPDTDKNVGKIGSHSETMGPSTQLDIALNLA